MVKKINLSLATLLRHGASSQYTPTSQSNTSTDTEHKTPRPIITEGKIAPLRSPTQRNILEASSKLSSPTPSALAKPRLEFHGLEGKAAIKEIQSLLLSAGIISQESIFEFWHRDNDVSGTQLQQAFVTGLDKINQDEEILYLEDLANRPNAEATIQELKSALKRIGFEANTPVGHYRYTGTDSAQALRALEKTRPLIFDCASSLHFVKLVALLDTIGPEKFNRYIQSQYDGTLSIDPKSATALVGSQSILYQNQHHPVEASLPTDLNIGDHIWIQGPALGYLYHPASTTNAYNLLVSALNNDESVTLKGFVSSTGNNNHGDWSYNQMRTELLQTYNKPLTLGDLKFILANSQTRAMYTDQTYADAINYLNASQPEAYIEALSTLMDLTRAGASELDERFKTPTKLMPPPADSIRGVVIHTRARESITQNALMNASPDITVLPVDPEIGEDATLGNILSIPNYRTELPHQRLVLKAAEDFITQIREKNNDFKGLILFGKPGTGKTLACDAIANTMKTDGKKVWSVKFSDESTLLSPEEEMSALNQMVTEGEKAFYDKALDKYADAWHKADLIYIDDTNTTHGSLNSVSNAAIIFARKHNKSILINSNTNPAKILRDTIELPFDSISIYNVEGPDNRVTTSWYQTCEPTKTQPNNFPFAATDTQINISAWLHALQESQGQNGLAIFGAPGTGKTTAIRTFFENANLPEGQVIWVDPVSARNVDANSLNQSEAQYLIVDDCNKPSDQQGYQKIMDTILHNESLFNKHGEAIKVILVSNRSVVGDFINDTAGLINDDLTPRMESRYHGRFKTLIFDDQHDFRATDKQRQISIVQSRSEANSKDSNTFNLDDFLTKKRRITDMAIAAEGPRNSPGSFEFSVSPKRSKQFWDERKVLEKKGFEQLENTENIQLSMSHTILNEHGPYWWSPIVMRALDVIEHNPKATLKIQSTDDPDAVLNTLFKGLDEIDKTGMYQSRLKRMVVSENQDTKIRDTQKKDA